MDMSYDREVRDSSDSVAPLAQCPEFRGYMRKSFTLPPQDAWDFTLVSPAFSQQITSLSPRQQDRLEAQGKFSKSTKIGQGRNGRKARVLREIIEWNRARIADRAEAA